MTSKLPNCPCCEMDDLFLNSYELENGQLHYKVVCHTCGVEFHHADFYGYNATVDFFEKVGRGECEDEGGDDEFMCSHCGYTHDYTPEELKDPEAFSFCPTCGFEVSR